jgi:urease accessory protein
MDLIRTQLTAPAHGVLEVTLPADRLTLAKLRWRGVAEDGREFGFDLEKPLTDGAPFFAVDGTIYVVAQQPEPVLEITIPNGAEGARIGWLIGNLHFTLEIAGGVIRGPADSALRQMLEREHIPFTEAARVFKPMRQGHVH